MVIQKFVLWVAVTAIAVVLVYAVIPNILVRVLRMHALRNGRNIPAVALTFDDGPDPQYTPRLLDALQAVGIHATFFVIVNKATRHPDLMERILEEGHEVQVHGLSHAFVPSLLPFSTIAQVRTASKQLRDHFGIQTTLYRPTWGLSNLVTLLSLKRLKHRLVTWSIMVGDWRMKGTSHLLSAIDARLQPGAVIVLHDSDETPGAAVGAPEQVIQLIPQLAELVSEKRFKFVTLSELL